MSKLKSHVSTIALVLSLAVSGAQAQDAAEENPLHGKLEGPEIVIDPESNPASFVDLMKLYKERGAGVVIDHALMPKTFQEAPLLAEEVTSGKLPPVAERLPEAGDVLVVKPVHAIGKYGGTFKAGFTGIVDNSNVSRVSGRDNLVYGDWTAQFPIPNIFKSWEFLEGGKTIRFHMRKGMKWSDGAPFTAEDILFWYKDMYRNADLNPSPTAVMAVNNEQGTIEKIDDFTVDFKFSAPYNSLPWVLSFFTPVGGQQAFGKSAMGGFAPAHYLKQFHPAYTAEDKLAALAKEGGFDKWTQLFKAKNDWQLNVELPVTTPWKTTTPANKTTWVLERNPYYWQVDTAGNQLPYIDKMVWTLAENLELINLRALGGQYDFQMRGVDINKVPLLLESAEKFDYTVRLDPMQNGSDVGIWFNLDFQNDPEMKKWVNNKDFRHALSMCIDRDQINETFFLGLGTPGSGVVADGNRYNPGPEYRKLWSEYKPDEANKLLDGIGLDKKDADGLRLRPDGSGKLTFPLVTLSAVQIDLTSVMDMVTKQWKACGIDATVKSVDRSVAEASYTGNELVLYGWPNDTSDAIFAYPFTLFPIDPKLFGAPMIRYAEWFSTSGEKGIEPPEPMRRLMDLYRKGISTADEDERDRIGKEMWKIFAEETWYIGIVGQSGANYGVRVFKNNLKNIPDGIVNSNQINPPATARAQTWYFD